MGGVQTSLAANFIGTAHLILANITVHCISKEMGFKSHPLRYLASPTLTARRRYCDVRRPSVCVSAEPRLHAALVSAAKVMCIVSNDL